MEFLIAQCAPSTHIVLLVCCERRFVQLLHFIPPSPPSSLFFVCICVHDICVFSTGSIAPIPCPLNYFCNSTGTTSPSLCLSDQFCPVAGAPCSSSPISVARRCTSCFPGFYATQSGGCVACTAGSYCVGGTMAPTACLSAAMCLSTGAFCPAGYFCDVTGVPAVCPPGFYCPVGNNRSPLPCPFGYVCAGLGLSAPRPCPSFFTSSAASTACTIPIYLSTVAGSGVASLVNSNISALATFNTPQSIAFDSFGNAIVSDNMNNVLRKIMFNGSAAGSVATWAGSTNAWADGALLKAAFLQPNGISFDGFGNLWIAETNNRRIRMVNATSNVVTTVAGSGALVCVLLFSEILHTLREKNQFFPISPVFSRHTPTQ
jgi:hypothetical protein